MGAKQQVRLSAPNGTIVRLSEDEAKRIGRAYRSVDGDESSEQRSEVPNKSWKVDELKAYADEHEVDLGGATKKADILAVIELAAEDEAEGEDDDE